VSDDLSGGDEAGDTSAAGDKAGDRAMVGGVEVVGDDDLSVSFVGVRGDFEVGDFVVGDLGVADDVADALDGDVSGSSTVMAR